MAPDVRPDLRHDVRRPQRGATSRSAIAVRRALQVGVSWRFSWRCSSSFFPRSLARPGVGDQGPRRGLTGAARRSRRALADRALGLLLRPSGIAAGSHQGPGLRAEPRRQRRLEPRALRRRRRCRRHLEDGQQYGFTHRAIGLYTAVTGFWNILARLALPLAGLVALLVVGARVSGPVLVAAGAGAAVCALVVALVVAALANDRFAPRLIAVVVRAAGSVARLINRPEPEGLEKSLARQRISAVELLKRGRGGLVVGMLAYLVLQGVLMWACLAAVGSELGWAEVTAAYACGRMLTTVVLTPGGTGFAETGTAAVLIALGGDPVVSVAGVLLFSFFTFVCEIPEAPSPTCGTSAPVAGGGAPSPAGRSASARLVEPEHVSGRVTEGAVADAVGLVDRLLENLAAGCADPLEGGVAVVGGEDDGAQQALGQQLGHDLPILRRGVGVGEGRLEDDGDVGLGRRSDGHPAHPLEGDVIADLKAEHVAVEGEGLVVVVDGDEAGRKRDVHALQPTVGQRVSLLRS